MVNFYASPLTYGQTNGPLTYDDMGGQINPSYPVSMQRSSSIPAATGGVLLGAAGGTILGFRKNPNISKSGEISDTFAKKAYERYVKKVPDAGKEAYNQGLEILKKLDKIKTPDELRALVSANPEAAELMCAELNNNPEEFINNITQKNLNANKKAIKEKLNAGNRTRYQNMKNLIQSCWNKDKKKLEKPEGMEKDLFKAIKKASKSGKGKIIAKYAAITAAIGGTIGFIAHKLFSAKNNIS